MLWRQDGTRDALRSPIPWIVLGACLSMTTLAWKGLDRSRHEEAARQFDARAEAALAALRTRTTAYEQVAVAGAAHIAASRTLDREGWRDFVSHLRLDERYPGIQALGFAERAARGGRGAATAVRFVEPFEGRNARLLGYDMSAEPARRAAMDLAVERRDATISGPVVLSGEARREAGEAPQRGFIVFVPVMRDPPGGRPRELAGFVFAPFRMQDFVGGLLDEAVLSTLDLRVHDGGEATAATLMVDTRAALRGEGASGAAPMFHREAPFAMPGRAWTVAFDSRPAFDAAATRERPWGLLALGTAGSLVVCLLTLALVAAWHRTRQLSMRDPLTGLFNRRYLEETMGRELTRAKRRLESVGVIIMDLDHFKQLNDTHGHDAGDLVLSRMGQLLREATRGSDIPCRFGGEEFAVILPGATLEVARERAEAIRVAFGELDLQFDFKPLGPLTLSAGVAALQPAGTDWASVLLKADRALYTAKQAGRNRVLAAVAD